MFPFVARREVNVDLYLIFAILSWLEMKWNENITSEIDYTYPNTPQQVLHIILRQMVLKFFKYLTSCRI